MSTQIGIGYTGEDALEEYIYSHLDPETELMNGLFRATNMRLLNPRMATGHIQGSFLSMLVKMIHPGSVLELGTFTAYSTLCMAAALPSGSHIDTVEIDDELEDFIKEWIGKSPWADIIELHIGNALTVVPLLNRTYDMLFIDADKRQYPAYYEQLFKYVNPGGYIVVDNTLWNGHVIDPAYDKDPQTVAVRKFNDMVAADNRVEITIVPIRDGLTIIRKKDE